MAWIWQLTGWPDFIYDAGRLAALERAFLLQGGESAGAFRHAAPDDRDMLRIELIGEEALKTSEIEGEMLDRASVQSSLRRQFGLDAGDERARPAERGIAELMGDLYRDFAQPLRHETMFAWHHMVLRGNRSGVRTIGDYRAHDDPMQIVSGPMHAPRVHFEAPPSTAVAAEMERFVAWFNASAPDGSSPLPALTRAGIAHFHFECIHPFEDGNGRIGRALAEKALAQNLGRPSLIALATTIQHARKDYYAALERANTSLEITDWLLYFAQTVLAAQAHTMTRIEFCLAKARFFERMRGQLNARQEKVLARMFREGPDGFRGGLSAANYVTIAKTSTATATRDLQDLVAKEALLRRGERRYARYELRPGERLEKI